MEKICIHCHYVGKSKKYGEPSYFGIVCTALLGLIFLLLGFWHPLFILGTYLSISLCLILLRDCFDSGNICPNCNEQALISLRSKNAREIIKKNNLAVQSNTISLLDALNTYDCLKDEKRVICTRCHSTGAGTIESLCHLRMGSIVLLLGLISIPLAYLTPFSLVGSFIYLIFGITMVLCCFIEDRVCRKCKAETMIPLSTSKAKLIIAEQHLDIDEDYIISIPPMFHYKYGLYVLFVSWILIGFFIYKLFEFFSNP